jgi:hypothetical protein
VRGDQDEYSEASYLHTAASKLMSTG